MFHFTVIPITESVSLSGNPRVSHGLVSRASNPANTNTISPTAEHLRFLCFAQENSAIVLASKLACFTFPGERWRSARRYSDLNINTKKYRPADTGRSPDSPKKNACQLTGNHALLPT